MSFDQIKDATNRAVSLDAIDWQKFLGRPSIGPNLEDLRSLHAGKVVLITGGGGSIGSYLARFVQDAAPREIILLDSSEHNLYESHSALASRQSSSRVTPILMDIASDPLLDRLLADRRPDIIYHTAAFKHVPLLELNPLAAVRSNVIGAYALAKAARRHKIPRVVAISTDKAVNPRSVLGVTKRVAELIFLALNGPESSMAVVRFGNVLASRGSVAPLFLRQIAEGGPVTITDPHVRRYFLTLDDSIQIIVAAASRSRGGLFVPELGEPVEVVRLAEYLIRESGAVPRSEVPIVFTGLRPGDKMTEDLIGAGERKRNGNGESLFEIETPLFSEAEIRQWTSRLEALLTRGDIYGMIDALRKMVPEYQSAREVMALARERKAAGGV